MVKLLHPEMTISDIVKMIAEDKMNIELDSNPIPSNTQTEMGDV
jgi:hypothetical protein